ncbi:histidine phosphatase family protein [Bradyrhizobium sp. USDA 4486]
MSKIIHLIRHGHHALLGHVLCGRMAGVELDEVGCIQMSSTAEQLRPRPAIIQSSPQRRALQSASILAAHLGQAVEIVPALDELDYGAWTGRTFAELDGDAHWSLWNSARATSHPPGGESMQALQQRVVGHIEHLFGDPCSDIVAVVSHAETIRAALLHYAGIALDDFLAIEIDPASISTLSIKGTKLQIVAINQQVPA